MTNTVDGLEDPSADSPDDFERAQTTAADVESAGRSCVVIIALAIVIIVILGIWVLYTAS
jgi:hypothetical protein